MPWVALKADTDGRKVIEACTMVRRLWVAWTDELAVVARDPIDPAYTVCEKIGVSPVLARR